jgi:Domain of unknown function (DUF4440)
MTKPQPLDTDARLRAVQTLWATYREHGPAVAAELLHPEVEFVTVDGNRYEGHEGVRGFFASFDERGASFVASPFTFEPHPPDVLVVGHRRIRGPDEMRGDYLYFVHGFRDGKVCRLSAHASREEALEYVAQRRDEAND